MAPHAHRALPFVLFILLVMFIAFISIVSNSKNVHRNILPKLASPWFLSYYEPEIPTPREQAANATLGVSTFATIAAAAYPGQFANRGATLQFEKILALSLGTPWRVDGLKAAANHTGLHIELPPEPHSPQVLVDAFAHIGPIQEDGHGRPSHGQAMAWMAHIDLLKHIIQSEYDTTLIIEDDVDWDVNLRSQIQLISDNVRNYTSTSEHDTTPYGCGWDVLWLGHCGEWAGDEITHSQPWADDTAISKEQYMGPYQKIPDESLPEQHRWVGETVVTVCTFAYGVSKTGAQKIVDVIGDGKGEAFDVMLTTACREKGLKCLTVNPEVVHHHVPAAMDVEVESEIAVADQGVEGTAVESGTDMAERHVGSTRNIVDSVRCRVLFDSQCIGDS